MEKKFTHGLYLLIFVCIAKLHCVGQNVYTFVGSGTAGFGGDGGTSFNAQINFPGGITMDVSGNLYIADYNNHRIRKINSFGIISTIAGTGIAGSGGDGGNATLAQLNLPTGVAIDAIGNIYIAEPNNSRVRKINTSGIITTFAGTGIGGFSGDGGPANLAQLEAPMGVAVDGAGNVYIADFVTHRIRKINSSGIISTIAGNGTVGFSGDGGLASSCQLNSPSSVACDISGNLFISDTYNNRIRKINTSGIISTIVGTGTGGYNGDGILSTTAQLNNPSGLTLDNAGNLYIADANNHRLRMVNTSSIISTIAGIGTAGYSGDAGLAINAQLNYPCAVTVDGSSNVFISDGSNHRIREICSSNCLANITDYEINKNSFSVSPNPSMGEFLFKGSFSETIYISNSLGKQVTIIQLNEGNNYSDKLILAECGIYFASGNKTRQKLIVLK